VKMYVRCLNDVYTAECGCEGVVVENCEIEFPDLNPAITVLPNTGIRGERPMRFTLQVREVSGFQTDVNEDIAFTVNANPFFTINWEPNATSVPGVSGLDNSNWIFDDSLEGFGIWVWRRAKDANGRTIPIQPFEVSVLGFVGVWDAGASAGQSSFTMNIVNGSGGEINTSNNTNTSGITYSSE